MRSPNRPTVSVCTLVLALANFGSPLAVAASAAQAAGLNGGMIQVAAADEKSAKPEEADARAKADDCSRQADAKKLHGAARKKFRSACKRGK